MTRMPLKLLVWSSMLMATSFFNPGCVEEAYLDDQSCSKPGDPTAETLVQRLEEHMGTFEIKDARGTIRLTMENSRPKSASMAMPTLFGATSASALSCAVVSAIRVVDISLTWQPSGEQDAVSLLQKIPVEVWVQPSGPNGSQELVASIQSALDAHDFQFSLVPDRPNEAYSFRFVHQGGVVELAADL